MNPHPSMDEETTRRYRTLHGLLVRESEKLPFLRGLVTDASSDRNFNLLLLIFTKEKIVNDTKTKMEMMMSAADRLA
jgi:hypothetical protein